MRPAKPSAAYLELEQLAKKLSETATVDAWTDGNGNGVIVEALRTNGRVARFYCAGASSPASAERVALAAAREMVGVTP